jgi:hypothetical protein
MTIEEMIRALNYKPDVTFGQVVMMNPKTAEEIISLLRTVRVLRGAITITLNVGQIDYTEVPHITDSETALLALAAFDILTKENA